MSTCGSYDPDNIFKRFRVVEFPISYVELSTTLELDVEVDLEISAYLKTLCDGQLMIFDDAREVSAPHRAFHINFKNNHVIEITFIPKNECITKAKHDKHFDNRFVFDLRLIKIDGSRCCFDELHSEIGRYYISGQFEYCQIYHSPENINFGDVIINTKQTKYMRIQNGSSILGAKIQYIRTPGVHLEPETFSILPNKSVRVLITIKPTCLKINTNLTFKIINPHSVFHENQDENFITYIVNFKLNVIYRKHTNDLSIESLHKINELNPNYTYIDKELIIRKERNQKALNYLRIPQISYQKKTIVQKHCMGKDKCYSMTSKEIKFSNFCQSHQEAPSTYDIFQIRFIPLIIKFGRVGTSTYGENNFTIHNNTRFDITVEFLKDKCVLYSDEKKVTLKIKMKPFMDTNISIFCLAHKEGTFEGIFGYLINRKYFRTHPYSLQIGTPTLMVNEKILKFGMVTTESFITSVPIKIYNYFNISVDFKWNELHSDTPFEITPNCGTIPRHSCRICDVHYICKATKTKTHEVDLLSISKITRSIPFELSVVTRKLSIKFLQAAVMFKDIALNIETVEKVRLENSSREIALFYVVEPLIPGFRIEPMCGTIRPKMVMVFDLIIKIPCVIEFAFDIYVKINNKENVILPVSGNVMEPKASIHPKIINMARIPCFMTTYVPVTFQNSSSLKTVVEVLDNDDENIFKVYAQQGNERKRISEFNVDGGQTKTVFIKVYDVFRREYEMYIPFRINGLLGPPDNHACSTELRYYIEDYEKSYENNSKVKIKSINKDICYCRISGVITVPWIAFSVDTFELDYMHNKENTMNFTMTNISKYYLYVTILTSKLAPIFTLELNTEDNKSIINESHIKFELNTGEKADFILKFHPKSHGKFVSTALLYLDKLMTIPYYNLTFIGKRQTPDMNPSTYRIIFPPCYLGKKMHKELTLKMEGQSTKELFSCYSKEEKNLTVEIIDSEIVLENNNYYTYVSVDISVSCITTYARNITLNFLHDNGSSCEVEVCFCFTFCPLTLHAQSFATEIENNPYPYYPLKSQRDLFNYMKTCTTFLEKWMFQQGFRRDLYPTIPDTFHAISAAISSQAGAKSKGINVSYLNFIRRIAGPLMKHVRKILLVVTFFIFSYVLIFKLFFNEFYFNRVTGVDESFKCVKEVHDTYREIITLLRSRGANLWVLQAKFLLSYDQFIIYTENVTPKFNADIIFTQQLLADAKLYERLNKQSWIDFILQSYKVFVLDSCFFECVCVSSQPRDVVKILIEWYNENISIQHDKLRGKNAPTKRVTNLTTDLSDGIAVISTIFYYCPFMEEHFQLFCEIDKSDEEGTIINNACLIIEALNTLRLYFPLSSKDFLQPNYLVMLFLSIHLYIVLPMFKPKDRIEFNPPLLRSSSRQLGISPSNQESLVFSYILLNNTKNNFTVEKALSSDNGKKIYLSVTYTANFVEKETAILLIHGFNKTRIFDTYVIFMLTGHVGSLYPLRKCKVTGPLYRPNKVDVLVASPFLTNAVFKLTLTDNEPTIPVEFEKGIRPKFCINRLHLIDQEITLSGIPKESGQEVQDHKLYFQIVCLSTQIENSWLWLRSDIGEFFIRITTQPRWDLAIDTLQAKVQTWPLDPCSCGEACECYRTTVLMIPHRNELMLKSLRYALLEQASDIMIHVFDQLIESATGKIILGMLLKEGGTNISEVQHILRNDAVFRITSRTLLPRLERVTLAQHTGALLALPVTIPAQDKLEKYSVTFTSECGMDIRTYRIIFIESYSE